MTSDSDGTTLEQLLDIPDLTDVLEDDRFKQFLDHIPFAIAVSELHPSETITYVNIAFECLTGQRAADAQGKSWNTLPVSVVADDGRHLSEVIATADDYIGAFTIINGDTTLTADAWSNIIQDDDGHPMFRLIALAEIEQRSQSDHEDFEKRIADKDTQLRELQHRVMNNLQMITALIRLEARNISDNETGEKFDRLAGRVGSLSLLYRSLSEGATSESIDLGVYLSQIASAVMVAHAVEGIHLDLQVDTWPVSINVAMPTGLVVNELLTNALKHAFAGRDGGKITLHSLVDETGCKVIVADDGIGLADGVKWPKPGKLGMLIVKSLLQNANARLQVDSAPNQGMRVTILFSRASADPELAA